MASNKVTARLTAGAYDSRSVNHHSPPGRARCSRDWTYAKAEQRVVDGTSIGYDTDLNPDGLRPNTKLTILEGGNSF
jgi:hypothetical protein